MKRLLFLLTCLLLSHSAFAQYYPYLHMQDSNDYSRPFLMGIEDYQTELGKVELLGDLMIADGIDTFAFPKAAEIDEIYMLVAEKEGKIVFVSLTRRNYTSLDYDLWIEGPDEVFGQSGTAHLPTSFFMGAEVDESSISGLSYTAYEYYDDENQCPITFRLGHEEESGEGLLAKVILSCKGDGPVIGLEDFPTLQIVKK